MSARKTKRATKLAEPAPARLPPEISSRIDVERRNLQQAAEVLAALAIAFDHVPDGIDFADAVMGVRAMVAQAVTALDPTALQRAPHLPARAGGD